MAGVDIHSVVALLEDLPEVGLVRGEVGAVVENWAPGVYEVEFADDNGKAYAMVALKAERLMRLHLEPVHQAAWRSPSPACSHPSGVGSGIFPYAPFW